MTYCHLELAERSKPLITNHGSLGKLEMTRKEITKSNLGLSLIEIMVTLAIVSLIIGLGVGMIDDLSDSDLREASFRLQGTIKYIYNEAAIKKKYYRMVFDLDAQEYFVESKSDPFFISNDENKKSSLDKPKKSLIDQESLLDQAMEEEKQEEQDEFAQVEDTMLKPKHLPSGVKIVDLYLSHLPDKISKGKAELYFFPNGWVEKAVIHLGNDEEDNYYSLEVMSATGKVKVTTGYLETEIESIKDDVQQ